MKVLILTQYFIPEMGAPQTRLFELGQALMSMGWDVEILTALPNYPTGKIFYEYQNKEKRSEYIEKILVHHVPLYPSKSKKFFLRILSYISFAFSAYYWGKKVCSKPNILFVESPPLFIGPSAIALSKYWEIPYVFNVSDLWPDTFLHMGVFSKHSIFYYLMRKLEIACYKNSSGVTGQSSGIIETVKNLSQGTPTALVTNGVSSDRFGRKYRDEAIRCEYRWEGKCVFIYAGLHGLAQGLNQILDVAECLKEKTGIEFALFGDGPLKTELIESARKRDIKNIHFYKTQKRESIPSLLASADVAIIPLGMNIHGAIPSKIYEAMASELPIILLAQGEAADRVNNANAGLCVPCNDLASLELAIQHLADDPILRLRLGKNGRIAAEQTYSRKATAEVLSKFLYEIMLK